MKFNNLPQKVKRTPEQKAIEAYKNNRPSVSLICIMEALSQEETVNFCLFALKNTNYKSYKLGIQNLEEVLNEYASTKDEKLLVKASEKMFNGPSDFDKICNSILYLLRHDVVNHSYIGQDLLCWIYGIYEFSEEKEDYINLLSDLLAFKYNNTNFRLLYGT